MLSAYVYKNYSISLLTVLRKTVGFLKQAIVLEKSHTKNPFNGGVLICVI